MDKIELLISTMNRKPDFLKKLNIKTDVVVVNQCENDSKKEFNFYGHHVTWIDSTTRGLSRSRNIAIENSKAEYIVLTDDDMEYRNNYPEKILEAFEKHKDVDILAFQINGIERKFKNYPRNEKWVSYLRSMKLSSVELVFRRKSIVENKITFKENFGSGAEFKMGEENILLFECLKNKLKIKYIPYLIADLHIGESTWFTGFNQKYFYDRGAVYFEMFGEFAPIMLFQFIIRKYCIYKGQISLLEAWNQSISGLKKYKNDEKKRRNTTIGSGDKVNTNT